MGREEKRQREQVTKQLEKRLHREPTEEEIDKALESLRTAKGFTAQQRDQRR